MATVQKMMCGECGMPCDARTYHPHLHCVIWKAYHMDPATVLSEHGYKREST